MSARAIHAERRARLQQRQIWTWRGMLTLGVCAGLWLIRDLEWGALWPSAGFIAKGLGASVLLSVLSIGLGFLVAIPMAAARAYGARPLKSIAVACIESIRCTPELMVIFWVYFGVPRITGNPVDGWFAAIFSMTLVAAAYMAEIIRAGLKSVNIGQWEAGRATGLRDIEIFSRIILPQALKNMLMALLSQSVMLFKTTSLVYIVGVIEFFRAMQIVNNRVYAPFATYALLAIVYFVCCWLITRLEGLIKQHRQ